MSDWENEPVAAMRSGHNFETNNGSEQDWDNTENDQDWDNGTDNNRNRCTEYSNRRREGGGGDGGKRHDNDYNQKPKPPAWIPDNFERQSTEKFLYDLNLIDYATPFDILRLYKYLNNALKNHVRREIEMIESEKNAERQKELREIALQGKGFSDIISLVCETLEIQQAKLLIHATQFRERELPELDSNNLVDEPIRISAVQRTSRRLAAKTSGSVAKANSGKQQLEREEQQQQKQRQQQPQEQSQLQSRQEMPRVFSEDFMRRREPLQLRKIFEIGTMAHRNTHTDNSVLEQTFYYSICKVQNQFLKNLVKELQSFTLETLQELSREYADKAIGVQLPNVLNLPNVDAPLVIGETIIEDTVKKISQLSSLSTLIERMRAAIANTSSSVEAAPAFTMPTSFQMGTGVNSAGEIYATSTTPLLQSIPAAAIGDLQQGTHTDDLIAILSSAADISGMEALPTAFSTPLSDNPILGITESVSDATGANSNTKKISSLTTTPLTSLSGTIQDRRSLQQEERSVTQCQNFLQVIAEESLTNIFEVTDVEPILAVNENVVNTIENSQPIVAQQSISVPTSNSRLPGTVSVERMYGTAHKTLNGENRNAAVAVVNENYHRDWLTILRERHNCVEYSNMVIPVTSTRSRAKRRKHRRNQADPAAVRIATEMDEPHPLESLAEQVLAAIMPTQQNIQKVIPTQMLENGIMKQTTVENANMTGEVMGTLAVTETICEINPLLRIQPPENVIGSVSDVTQTNEIVGIANDTIDSQDEYNQFVLENQESIFRVTNNLDKVCTMFVNYNIDLINERQLIVTEVERNSCKKYPTLPVHHIYDSDLILNNIKSARIKHAIIESIIRSSESELGKLEDGRRISNNRRDEGNGERGGKFSGRRFDDEGDKSNRRPYDNDGGQRRGNRDSAKDDMNNNRGEDGEKPREFYIPPEPTNNEDELFSTGISSGINFSKYEHIPVKVSGENVPIRIESFDEAGLREFIVDNVKKSGYKVPTPIQKVSIPVITNGRDLMACAQTGSGKTAAFLLPILSSILEEGRDLAIGQPQAVIISPTRELAVQIYNEARKFAYNSYLKISIVYGGTSFKYQNENLTRGCHVLIATPGRLLDFVNRGSINFSDTCYMVLDEADRMLDMGFLENVRTVMSHPTMNDERQTLMFSATFPEDIQRLAGEFLNNYVFVAIGVVGGACKDVQQEVLEVSKFNKRAKLLEFLRDGANGTIVFVETKRGADFLASFFSETDIPTTSIHGDRLQSQREMALRDFKTGKMKVLIATSVASRGLDIKNVNHVINYDMPKSIDDYVHRIGRTGRVGNKGRATTFFDPDQDSGIVSELVKVLEGANQEVPTFLRQLASGGGGGGSCFKSSGFGGLDVRKSTGENIEATEDEEAWD